MSSSPLIKGCSRWLFVVYIVFSKFIVAHHHKHASIGQETNDSHDVAKRMDIESCDGNYLQLKHINCAQFVSIYN